jgi:two-component system heavy metal sensor histidine kinase CusS
MCSMNDSKSKRIPTAPRPWSMWRRLSLFLVISFVAIFSSSSFLLYLDMLKHLDKEEKVILDAEIDELREALSSYPGDPMSLDEEVRPSGMVKPSLRQYSRVLDGRGEVLVETSGMAEMFPKEVFPPYSAARQIQGAGKKWKKSDGKVYLLKTAPGEDGSGKKGRYFIQIALDISIEESILANYRQKILFELIAVIMLSAGICVTITRKGMRPLEELAATVERITAAHLHERISAGRWPEELATLASAFDGMLERLEDAFGRLSRFSADLSHELRGPVNNLMGTAEVTLSKERTPEEYRQVMESGMEEYQRLSRIIERLLFLARADNNEILTKRTTFDLRRELGKICELYEAMADEQGIEIICNGEGTLLAEPELFGRAVGNLLVNALQHTPSGGKVTITGSRVSNHFVEVRVHDTGDGIPAEHLTRIFDRFYRVDSTRSRSTEGLGLGLSIVKSIMDLHEGTVSVESLPGKGTTFILKFPVD